MQRVYLFVIAPAVRWAGAAVFALSLIWFLFRYFGRFGAITPPPADWRAVAVNLLLFAAFAVHHSVFARTAVRDWIARRISASLERPLYVWVASVLLVVVCELWQPIGGLAWSVGGRGAWILRAITLAGLSLAVRSAVVIDVWELAGVRTRGRRPEGEFRASGPYGWIRHPIYLGWLLLVWSATPMTMTRFVFAAASSAYVLLAIPLEERTLRSTSSGAYADYARRVRWRLVPGVF
jgi:protein-S-isoprenylcysteine O-methyltransferase Ste14